MILSAQFALVIVKMGTKIILETIPTWYHLWKGTRQNVSLVGLLPRRSTTDLADTVSAAPASG